MQSQPAKTIRLPFPKNCPHCQTENVESDTLRQVGNGIWFNCNGCKQVLMFATVEQLLPLD